MSTSPHPSVFSCLLCGGVLPSALDDVFVGHMRDQHRAYFNMEFLHAAYFLDGEGLRKTKEFIESLTQNTIEQNTAEKNDETAKEYNEQFDDDEIFQKIDEYIEAKQQDDNGEQMLDTEMKTILKQDVKVLDESKVKVKIEKSRKVSKKCDCNITWKNRKEKLYHKKIVHLNYFNCETCNKTFKESVKFQRHILKHANKIKNDSNICEDCGYVGPNKYSVAGHKNLMHDNQIRICDICSKDFQGNMRLKIHRRRFHRNSEQCQQCGGVFRNLVKHIRTIHTIESDKKYQCGQCGKGFVDKTRLSTHTLSVHTDEKPFPCRFSCGYACSAAGNRTKHEKLKHSGLGQVVHFEEGFNFE